MIDWDEKRIPGMVRMYMENKIKATYSKALILGCTLNYVPGTGEALGVLAVYLPYVRIFT